MTGPRPQPIWRRARALRRAIVWTALLGYCALPPAGAQPSKRVRPAPEYLQLGRPDQAEGRAVLEAFRRRTVDTAYYLEFELRVLPRRGAERRISGRFWEDQVKGEPTRRIHLETAGAETRLLLRGGPEGGIWRWQAGDVAPVRLAPAAWLDPVAGTDVTAFDLQMPFLRWDEFVFEGVRKVRGRPAHAFLLYPPEAFAARHPEIAAIRLFLDTQFNALVQTAVLGQKGEILKALAVLDLKKVGERWIVKSIDVRNEVTRDKTRFVVTGVALDLDLLGDLFAPERLAGPAAAAEGVTRF
jgi:hypothetical protein